MSRETPLFITSRAYKQRVSERDEALRKLHQFEAAGPYLGLAQDLRARVIEESQRGESIDAALEIALGWVKDQEMRRLIEQHARDMEIKLTEAQEADIRREFIEVEQARINAEVAEQVARDEEGRRREVARTTEVELKRMQRDALLAKIDSDEAARVLAKFGELAVAKAEREVLIENLRDKARVSRLVDISDLPTDAMLTIGLNPQAQTSEPYSMERCDRVIALRVLSPENSILEVVDDSWMGNEDEVRRRSALQDYDKITMLTDLETYAKPRISIGAEPNFLNLAGEEIDLFGFEVRKVSVYDEPLFGE